MAACLRSIAIGIFTFMVVGIYGCSSSEDSTPDSGMTVETLSDGVIRIAHSYLPDIRIELDTLAVIDPWLDKSNYLFSSIGNVLGGDGSIYVIDRRNKEVVQLSLDGVSMKVIGRAGSGPGEFEQPGGLAHGDGELWVSDSRLRRMSVFDYEGGLVRDSLWPSGSARLPFRYFIGDHSFVFALTQSTSSLMSETNIMYLVRVSVSEAQVDTLLNLESEPYVRQELITESGQRFPLVATPIFSSYLWWALGGDCILTITTFDYRIEFRNLDGKLLRLLEAPAGDFRVTASAKKRWVEEGYKRGSYGDRWAMPGDPLTLESRESMPFAERRQAIIRLAVDPFDRIWALASTEDPARNRLDLFDWDGSYLGHLGDRPVPDTFLLDGSPVYEMMGEDSLKRFVVMTMRTP